MPHGDQEWIINARMLDVTHKACQESTHDIQVTEVLHELALFREEMEIASQLDNLSQVVIGILFICCVLDAVDERDQILVGDGKLVEQAVHLEESEAEVQH